MPAPPPDIGLTPPTRDDVSNRQAYEIELADPACAACHALITYPGFIFENYDAIGSYQTTDNGFAVDASTDIYVDGEFVAYENAVAMMPDLAEREVVSSCVALNWVTYLVGRRSREAISGVGSREIESCGGGDACVRGSIAEYAAEIAQCAGAPGADMNLPDLAGRLAASPLLLAGTIACGDKRCFAEFEECVITENVAAGAPDYACLPATGP